MGLGNFIKKAAEMPFKTTKKALTGHPIAAAKETVKPLQSSATKPKKKLPAFGKALYGAKDDM